MNKCGLFGQSARRQLGLFKVNMAEWRMFEMTSESFRQTRLKQAFGPNAQTKHCRESRENVAFFLLFCRISSLVKILSSFVGVLSSCSIGHDDKLTFWDTDADPNK